MPSAILIDVFLYVEHRAAFPTCLKFFNIFVELGKDLVSFAVSVHGFEVIGHVVVTAGFVVGQIQDREREFAAMFEEKGNGLLLECRTLM